MHCIHQPLNNEEEFVTCKNCKVNTLASVFQTKLVSQMMIKTDHNKLENFTCFNDAIQSFFDSKTMSNTYLRIEGRWSEKTIFDYWQREWLFQKTQRSFHNFLKLKHNSMTKFQGWILNLRQTSVFTFSFQWNMFNEWSVWSLRHWSMVYTTATLQLFYLYSQINIFIIRWTILLWT